MTDEELAKRLRDLGLHSAVVVADRLETLTAQLESTLKDRAAILEERDRTFALMLARAEAAEAERDAAKAKVERLGREVNVAKYGQPDFAWSVHLEAMAELQAERGRLREALSLIAVMGFSDDLGETAVIARMAVQQSREALKGESHD